MKIAIDITTILQYAKLIQTSCPKTGQLTKDYMFIDFNKSSIFFYSDKQIYGRISFTFEILEKSDIEEEVPTSFYVNIHKFIMMLKVLERKEIYKIVCSYDKKGLPIFEADNNYYQISPQLHNVGIESSLKDVEDGITLLKEQPSNRYIFTEKDAEVLSHASKFIDQSSKSEFTSVSMRKNEVSFVTITRAYFGELSFTLKDTDILFLHGETLKVFTTFEGEYDLFVYGSKTIIFKNSSAEFCFIAQKCNAELLDDETILEVVDLNSSVLLDIDELTNNLTELNSYYTQDSKPCTFNVESETVFRTNFEGLYDNIKLSMNMKECPKSLIGLKIDVNGQYLKNSLLILSKFYGYNNVRLFLSKDKMGCLIVGDEDLTEHTLNKYPVKFLLIKYSD